MDGQQSQEIDGEDLVQQQIAAATNSTLPITSAFVYRTAWHDLQDFRTSLNLTGPTTAKHVFAFLAKKHANKEWESPGTLWTRYSMLKTMIRIREGSYIDDGSTSSCESWLKGLSRTHNPKQSLQLTKEQVASFLINEKDSTTIELRLLLIFGFNLGLRTADLKKLQWKSVTQCATGLRITVDWATKTDQGARGNYYFIAREANPLVCGVTLFAEYLHIIQEADPARLDGDLWLKVIKKKDGKWTVIGVRGRNWITSIPSIVAKSLGLPNPELYTGHCYRRTSAQWQADAGATVLELQNQFGWKNSSMASVYTGQSLAARSASSRRCLLSADVQSNEAASNSNHQDLSQSLGSRQCSNKFKVHNGQQQVDLAAIDKSPQWPIKISGKNFQVYIGGSPSVQTPPQMPSSSTTPLLQHQQEARSNLKVVTEKSDDEIDKISDKSDSFAMPDSESELQLPINANPIQDLPAPNMSNVSDLECAPKKTKASKKPAVKKQKSGKTKAKSMEKQPVVSPMAEEQAASSSNVAPILSTRPIRIKKTTVHSNPYSRNVKGFSPSTK
jgi:integrase